MASSNSYQQILDEYPEYITKEQLYQICHISKKSAQNLLESGEIPCIDSGRKTHRFLIATTDVVDSGTRCGRNGGRENSRCARIISRRAECRSGQRAYGAAFLDCDQVVPPELH